MKKKTIRLLRGSISVFLAVIMLPMLTFAGTAADIARINYAKSILNSASELAVNGLLSGYNRDLYEKYGFFALTEDEEELERLACSYLEMTLEGTACGAFSDSYSKAVLKEVFGSSEISDLNKFIQITLAGAEVSGISAATPANTAVLKNQICEYMKYRGPLNMTEDLLERFGVLEGLSSESKVSSAKMDYDEALYSAGDAAEKLWQAYSSYIDGLSAVCGELSPGEWLEQGVEENRALVQLSLECEEALEKIETAGESCSSGGEDLKSYYRQQKKDAEAESEQLIHSYSEKISLIYGDIQLCESCCAALVYALDGCEDKRCTWRDSIEALEDGDVKDAYLKQYKEDAETLSQDAVASFLDLCTGTAAYWYEARLNFPYLSENRESEEILAQTALSEEGSTGELLRRLEKMYGGTDSSEDSGFLSALVSFAKTLGIIDSEGPDTVSDADCSGCLAEIDALAELGQTAEWTGICAQLSGENTEDISDSAQSSIASVTKLLSGLDSILDSAGEELLVIEYFSNMFSCAADAAKGEARETLSGQNLSENVLYQYELEYILYGNDSIYANTAAAYSSIFAIRAALNTVYAMTDTAMRSEALTAATTVAGWTGFGVPVLQNVILAVWAMAESVADMNRLLDGETVAVYKTKDSWSVSLEGLLSQINGSSAEEKKSFTGNLNGMSYRDYLTLFMLIEYPFNSEGMLVRCAKLIQINMNAEDGDFRLTRAYTAINLGCSAFVNTSFLGAVYHDSGSAVTRYDIDYSELGYGSTVIYSEATGVY